MLQSWNCDLPHMRHQCGVHQNFSRTHRHRDTGKHFAPRSGLAVTVFMGGSVRCCYVRWFTSSIVVQQPKNYNQSSTHSAPLVLQCYCFLCDAEASQCKEWGTGEAASTLPQ